MQKPHRHTGNFTILGFTKDERIKKKWLLLRINDCVPATINTNGRVQGHWWCDRTHDRRVLVSYILSSEVRFLKAPCRAEGYSFISRRF